MRYPQRCVGTFTADYSERENIYIHLTLAYRVSVYYVEELSLGLWYELPTQQPDFQIHLKTRGRDVEASSNNVECLSMKFKDTATSQPASQPSNQPVSQPDRQTNV